MGTEVVVVVGRRVGLVEGITIDEKEDCEGWTAEPEMAVAKAASDGNGVDEVDFGDGPNSISGDPSPCANKPLSPPGNGTGVDFGLAYGVVDGAIGCGPVLIALWFSANKALSASCTACASNMRSWLSRLVELVVTLLEVVFVDEPRALLAAVMASSLSLLSNGMCEVALACGDAVLIADSIWAAGVATGVCESLSCAPRPSSTCGRAAAVMVERFVNRRAIRQHKRCIVRFGII